MPSSRCEPRARVAVVVSGWPRLSETFALADLLALHDHGMLAAAFATKPGDPSLCQPGTERLDVTILPPGPPALQAASMATALAGTRVTGVHGYFAHDPACVARSSAALLGVPFGFSAHALDVRKLAAAELARRAADASAVLACNADVAASLRAAGAVPTLVGHGVDVDRFHPPLEPRPAGLQLLAVGRLVEKKGFDVLLGALARGAVPWRLDLVGDGPQRARLVGLVEHLGLGRRVRVVGRLTHAALPAAYARADAVVVPSRVDARDDRDGLPNVVLEAMASGRPVIASDVAAIATAVRDGDTGLLVPPDDARRLAAALDRIGGDSVLRRHLGAARAAAVAEHDRTRWRRRFLDVIEQTYG